MRNYTDQELEQIYGQLPEAVKDAMFSADMTQVIEDMRKKYRLQIDQMGGLANETRMILFGLTHPKDYINNLVSRLDIDKETAKQIAQEINQKIFGCVLMKGSWQHSLNQRKKLLL